MSAVIFQIVSIDLLERDVRLRMPFRFGVVTLTESPQAFVRALIRLQDCFVFAVQVLPTIVFFASLTGVLYHLGVMQGSSAAWRG